MVNGTKRKFICLAAVLTVAIGGIEASASCCGGGTTAFYPSSAYSTYRPVAYTSYYGTTGWYPGYWLNRIRARLWGSPTTYVASYPVSYTAAYAPSYSVSYAPYASSGYASYAAPSGCSTCSTYSASYAPCSTCTSSVTLRPVCDPCSACCATCGTSGVVQASYEQPSTGCANCAAATQTAPQTYAPAQQPYEPAQQPTPTPQQTYGTQGTAPTADPNTPLQRQQQTQRPPTETPQNEIQPEPAADAEQDPYDVTTDENATFLQAPTLFDPNDRTAQRSIAPVRTAVYEKPVSYRNVSVQRITQAQAEADAVGWVSASD